ncbi:SRPBCC domain-containing protein [Streptomyces sp. NPDC090088]|uniref:SRPBCC family protein n=1 Tax=Streptomyces sp. NPDC090088 TaxID=3365944 RepID=UPI0037FE6DC2
MRIDNEFGVDVPVERAWEALTDLEALAPCMPGAQLTGVDGDVHHGKVRVKVGPVISQFQGTARFVEKDEAAHTAVIRATGRDMRGQGNASATVHARLRPEGTRTVVSVSTDLSISGKLAQFGSGMIKEISEKLFAQFVANVEEQLLVPADPPAPAPEPVPTASARADAAPASAVVRPSPAPEPVSDPEPKPLSDPSSGAPREAASPSATASASAEARPVSVPAEGESEPLDLMRLAGTSVYKRLIPLAVGACLIGVLVYLLVR